MVDRHYFQIILYESQFKLLRLNLAKYQNESQKNQKSIFPKIAFKVNLH